MTLEQPLVAGVILVATWWLFRTLLGGGLTWGLGGIGMVASARGAWLAIGDGILLGASLSVFIQAYARVSGTPFDWVRVIGLAAAISLVLGAFRSIYWIWPIVVGSVSVAAATIDVFTADIPRDAKFQFLVPLAGLVTIGLTVGLSMGLKSIPGLGGGIRGAGEGIELALLGTELAFGMHLPSLASVAAVGPLPHLAVLVGAAAAVIAVTVLPSARVPAGILLAAVLVFGDWSRVIMSAGLPISATTVTTWTMCFQIGAMFVAGAVRSHKPL